MSCRNVTMRTFAAFALLLSGILFVSGVFAPTPARAQPQGKLYNLYEVKGRVLDSDRNPVPWAIIRYNTGGFAFNSGRILEMTDENGEFSFLTESRSQRDFYLWVLPADETAIMRKFDTIPKDVGTIVLDKGHRVRGRVLDHRGEPISGAYVELAEKDWPAMRVFEKIVRNAVTDEKGEFVLPPVLPGNYTIEVVSMPTYPPNGFSPETREIIMLGDPSVRLDELVSQESSVVPFDKSAYEVFLQHDLVVDDADVRDVTLQEVELVPLRLRFADVDGKPFTEALRLSIRGTCQGVAWATTANTVDPDEKTRNFVVPDETGCVTLDVLQGLQDVRISCVPASHAGVQPLRYRIGNATAEHDWEVKLPTAGRETPELSVAFLRAATLDVLLLKEYDESPLFRYPAPLPETSDVRIRYAAEILDGESDDAKTRPRICVFTEENPYQVRHRFAVFPDAPLTLSAGVKNFDTASQELQLGQGESRIVVVSLRSTGVSEPEIRAEPMRLGPGQVKPDFWLMPPGTEPTAENRLAAVVNSTQPFLDFVVLQPTDADGRPLPDLSDEYRQRLRDAGYVFDFLPDHQLKEYRDELGRQNYPAIWVLPRIVVIPESVRPTEEQWERLRDLTLLFLGKDADIAFPEETPRATLAEFLTAQEQRLKEYRERYGDSGVVVPTAPPYPIKKPEPGAEPTPEQILGYKTMTDIGDGLVEALGLPIFYPVSAESIVTSGGVRILKRHVHNAGHARDVFYVLANTKDDARPVDGWFSFSELKTFHNKGHVSYTDGFGHFILSAADRVFFMDPQTGKIGRGATRRNDRETHRQEARVQLAPGETIILRVVRERWGGLSRIGFEEFDLLPDWGYENPE